ncbi:hypothetical protein, partial [Serratia nevei]|uniref:hypothetical protein n=1 Tax=Serratia nevei TaxID=2703794 RepID=UPI00254CF212
VILVGLAIDQIAQSGLSSLSVIYYSAQLFRGGQEGRWCYSSVGLWDLVKIYTHRRCHSKQY